MPLAMETKRVRGKCIANALVCQLCWTFLLYFCRYLISILLQTFKITEIQPWIFEKIGQSENEESSDIFRSFRFEQVFRQSSANVSNKEHRVLTVSQRETRGYILRFANIHLSCTATLINALWRLIHCQKLLYLLTRGQDWTDLSGDENDRYRE